MIWSHLVLFSLVYVSQMPHVQYFYIEDYIWKIEVTWTFLYSPKTIVMKFCCALKLSKTYDINDVKTQKNFIIMIWESIIKNFHETSGPQK